VEVAVALKRWILCFLTIALISALAGCSNSGSTSNVQNPPPPPAAGLSIAFNPAPPTTVALNSTVPLTAVVTNDTTNGGSGSGVDWSLSCQAGGTACGSLSLLHTNSGQANIYTPPSSFSGNSLIVNIAAFATANHSMNVLTTMNITAFSGNLKGTYVLETQGINLIAQAYQFAGVIVLDGNGNITSGEQTLNFYDNNQGVTTSKTDVIIGGNYFIGTDGRGTITINTKDIDVGNGTNGTETFSLVFLSNAKALIAETDPFESGTGTMDLQTSTATPTGGYAFVVNGLDISSGLPIAWGGILNIDSPNTISGNGSVTDQSLAGTITSEQRLSGTLTNPDSFGAVELSLTVPGYSNAQSYSFAGYIVDATHIKLIENDNASGYTGGVAVGQGTATGTFNNNSMFSGTYVFGIKGIDLTSNAPNSLTWAGLLTADGNGNLNGYSDVFLQANLNQGTSGSQISFQGNGTYVVETAGTGRVRASLNFILTPVPNFEPLFFMYLTGNGNPPLILYANDQSTSPDFPNYPSMGMGISYNQTAPLTFSGGDYGLTITQSNGTGVEVDGTGQMTANANALTGAIDTNDSFAPSFANPLSGTYAAPLANGEFTGSLSSITFDSFPFTADFYIIDANHGLFVETDLIKASTGVVSFGHYASRTPVCTGCP
jgi:hypothetical protein